jgi:ABC-2 type transport system permease protein
VGRLSFVPLYALGLFGHSQIFGTTFETIARWSPGGAVATLLAGAMHPAGWTAEMWWALLASVVYASVFTGIGIRWFQWSTR